MKFSTSGYALLLVSIIPATCSEDFKCKARKGCHFSGCDPVRSPLSIILDRNEFPITCEATSAKNQTATEEFDPLLLLLLLSSDGKSGQLTQKVADLEKSRNETQKNNEQMALEIKRLRDDVSDLTKKNSELREAQASNLERLMRLEKELEDLMLKPTEPTTAAPSRSGNAPPDTYRWGEWIGSACSTTCGNGSRKFERSCLNSLGNIVSFTLCQSGTIQEVRECSSKPCSVYLTRLFCEFRTAGEICGLTNSDKNNANWIQNVGMLPQPFVGPTNSALLKSDGYMYVDVARKDETPVAVIATVTTPQVAPGRYCIQISMFMSTEGDGTLNAAIYEYKEGLSTERVRRFRRNFSAKTWSKKSWLLWRQGLMTGQGTKYFEIEFVARRTAKSPRTKPTIAVDFIRIMPGECW